MCELVDKIAGAGKLVQRTLRARREGRLPRRFTRDDWAEACQVKKESTRRNFLLKASCRERPRDRAIHRLW